MSTIRPIGLSVLLGVCLLAACATTPEEAAALAEAEARVAGEISARQGKAVTQVCPRGSDGWKALGDDILLLEARGKWYMAELSGTCDPDATVTLAAPRTGAGSSCLQRGGDIFTGHPRSGERCVITALHEWDEDAETEPAAIPDPVEE